MIKLHENQQHKTIAIETKERRVRTFLKSYIFFRETKYLPIKQEENIRIFERNNRKNTLLLKAVLKKFGSNINKIFGIFAL